jgi:polysaccharide chain length determinant protein (PEP-CTERM system associated)
MQTGNFEIINRIIILTYQNKRWVVASFLIFSLSALVAGYNWPKSYTSDTTVYIEEENILGPLMQGTAVQTDVVDRGRLAREILFGRQIMQEILAIGGWLADNPTPVEQEAIMNGIQSRTSILNVGKNLVTISYKDTDPERAYKITKGFADLFIEGSLNAKASESKSAFDFIDMQVKEYEKKLKESEAALKLFHEENVDFREGAAGETNQRIANYRSEVEKLEQDLREALIKKASLESQLSGESETASGLSRSEQTRKRIAELQANLDVLRLSYHESYPDIQQLKMQIDELQEKLVSDEKRVKKARQSAQKNGGLFIDESMRASPLYQQLQGDLYQTNTLIETLKIRIKRTKTLLSEEIDRDKRINSAKATLANLTRDYNVNQDVYQDLLRRRENARVSMNLDREHQGISISINEPAYLPISPSGPRYIHIVLIGALLGLIVPVGIAYGMQALFLKIYDITDIRDDDDVVVIGQLSHFTTASEKYAIKKEKYILGTTIISTLLLISIVSIIKMMNG